ncbi:peptidoglycan-binding protein [Streptomyces albogriseolus]|uniref:peptidoglycan-binding protein n=1 Tax=Streptomyces albogriseolus TaxID=1887 RepID=UPI0035169489
MSQTEVPLLLRRAFSPRPRHTGRRALRAGRGSARGTENEHVTRLGRQPAATGSGRHRTQGPGPRRGEEDRRDAADFQRAQGRSGRAADGVPGPETWRRLFS